MIESGVAGGEDVAVCDDFIDLLSAARQIENRKTACEVLAVSYESELNCRKVSEKPVITDDGITTAKSAGYAVNFGCELVNVLLGPEKATAVSNAVYQP